MNTLVSTPQSTFIAPPKIALAPPNVVADQSMGQIRQGDILLSPVDKVPSGLKEAPSPAQGTALMAAKEDRPKGSHFLIGASRLWTNPQNGRVEAFESLGFVEVKHDFYEAEHASVLVPPGIWEVTRQREYSRSVSNLSAVFTAARD